jgi:REP element-mobilizing transposase RayT
MKSKFDPQKHHRRSVRLKGYDYSSEGAYYVTIVAQGRECLFGGIIDGEMHLSKYGEIIQKWWDEILVHFLNVELGAFVIMPNHIHGIIYIVTERRGEVLSPRDNPNSNNQDIISPHDHPKNNNQNVNIGDAYNQGGEINDEGVKTKNQGGETQNMGGETPPLRGPTLGQIVAYFKYQSTKAMNKIETENSITKFWQRSYYEHIIRNEKELQQKTDYILDNPSQWDEDDDNPMKS